jgi:hypothetical protein
MAMGRAGHNGIPHEVWGEPCSCLSEAEEGVAFPGNEASVDEPAPGAAGIAQGGPSRPFVSH